MRAGFLNPLVQRPDGGFALADAVTGRVLAERVEAALDSASRRRGLLGREGLAPGTALVIAPSNAVHTFFMRFPIDIVFVRRDGYVVSVKPHVKANRMAAALRGFAVIEMAAGEVGRAGIRKGDRLAVVAANRAAGEDSSGP